jgi:predicted signal transduction protein with EAL and GGDEF domain
VARLSGDEFTVLIEDVLDPATAIDTAERLAEELRLPLPLGNGQIVITASVGVAVSRRGAESSEELLCRADLAMYAAKEGGRARAAVFDEEATPQFVDRVELEAGLRSAIERDELVLHYQPIVALPAQDITGFEALVRWQHPARGLMAPAAFVSLAEETGLIIPIGRWVLEEACRTLAGWLDRHPGRAGMTMHVNVSAVQLHQAGFSAEVGRALELSGLQGGSLVLEITESVLVRADATAGVLRDLREIGVGVALDDFGTGYSSLAYLRRLPLEFVKIDQSFVNDLDDPDADTAIVRAIIDLAHTLGLGTVAEGVETFREVDALVALGCVRAQGYLFSVPVSAPAAEALLDQCPPLAAPVTASIGSRRA